MGKNDWTKYIKKSKFSPITRDIQKIDPNLVGRVDEQARAFEEFKNSRESNNDQPYDEDRTKSILSEIKRLMKDCDKLENKLYPNITPSDAGKLAEIERQEEIAKMFHKVDTTTYSRDWKSKLDHFFNEIAAKRARMFLLLESNSSDIDLIDKGRVSECSYKLSEMLADISIQSDKLVKAGRREHEPVQQEDNSSGAGPSSGVPSAAAPSMGESSKSGGNSSALNCSVAEPSKYVSEPITGDPGALGTGFIMAESPFSVFRERLYEALYAVFILPPYDPNSNSLIDEFADFSTEPMELIDD